MCPPENIHECNRVCGHGAVIRADAGVRPYRYARHEHCLTGESPEQALIAGIAQPKARVSIARWNLEEAGGKHLA